MKRMVWLVLLLFAAACLGPGCGRRQEREPTPQPPPSELSKFPKRQGMRR
jgi:hypothetical protein